MVQTSDKKWRNQQPEPQYTIEQEDELNSKTGEGDTSQIEHKVRTQTEQS